MDDYIDLHRRFLSLADDADPERLAMESYAASMLGKSTDKAWSDLLLLPRVVILGEPGSGKSWELRERARRLAGEGRPAFFLDLRRLITESIEQILGSDEADRFRRWRDARTSAWFFLDSVDESRLQSSTVSTRGPSPVVPRTCRH